MIFKNTAAYWSEKVESNDKFNVYLVCDKSKSKPYRWELLTKETFERKISDSFLTLDEAKADLDIYVSKLVAEEI